MEDTIKIQLIFTFKTPHGEYRDALYFTQEDWAKIKPEDIEDKKKERIDNWIYQLEHPVIPKEPTKEELEKELVELEVQKLQLENRKTELTSLIASK
jgi:hypothetical protein